MVNIYQVFNHGRVGSPLVRNDDANLAHAQKVSRAMLLLITNKERIIVIPMWEVKTLEASSDDLAGLCWHVLAHICWLLYTGTPGRQLYTVDLAVPQ